MSSQTVRADVFFTFDRMYIDSFERIQA
jgi:hypothetical protein